MSELIRILSCAQLPATKRSCHQPTAIPVESSALYRDKLFDYAFIGTAVVTDRDFRPLSTPQLQSPLLGALSLVRSFVIRC